MRKIICIAGVALFVMVFSVANAFGCGCGGGGAPCYDYGRSAAVFIGTVIALRTEERRPDRKAEEDFYAPRIFKFSVEQTFLGPPTREIEVSTGMGGGDCGYDFKLGSRYVVYAADYSRNNRLTTGTCSRTRPFEDASEDLEFFRGLGSRSPGVTINGEVKRARQNVATGNPSDIRPLANIGLVVERGDERREIHTDEEGRFRLNGLSPGKIKVTLLLPDELFTHKPEQTINVSDRGCAVVNYQVVDNGRLSGRVLGPEGQPVRGLLLALMEADHTDVFKDDTRFARTDDAGRYNYSALPPGQYLLALNLTRFPEPNDPTHAYPRTYYPGVTDVSKAETITLAAGEIVHQRDLLLPARREASILTGKVVWADGTGVTNATIIFRDVTYHDAKLNHSMPADELGYFTIKGYFGQVFVIEARSNRPYSGDRRRFEPMERVEPVRIVLTKPSEMVNIVITRLR